MIKKVFAWSIIAGLIVTTPGVVHAEELAIGPASVIEDEQLLNADDLNSNQIILNDKEVTIDDGQKDETAISAFGASNVKLLDSTKVNVASEFCRTIFCKERNGIYFLNTFSKNYYMDMITYDVIFYDLAKNTYTTVDTISNGSMVYIDNNAIYSLTSKNNRLNTPITVENEEYEYSVTYTVKRLDLTTGKSTEKAYTNAGFKNKNYSNSVQSFGYDQAGRLYVADSEMKLSVYDANGKLITFKKLDGYIGRFYGFDPVNGNFYFEGNYNWVYWGYDHSMDSLMCGNLSKSNTLTVPYANLSILNQNYFREHKNSCEMLNNQYLACLTTFSDETLMLLDSNAYNVNDYTTQSTNISLIDSSVSVSPINISNTNVVKLAIKTASSQFDDNYLDLSSEGTRCCLSEDGKTLIVKTDKDTLTEIDIATKKKKFDVKTKYPIYNFKMLGNKIAIVEKNEDAFYVETIYWQYPTDFTVSAPTNMKVADKGKVAAISGDGFSMDYTYKSSNPKVVSVDSHGNLLGWKKGNATISVTATQINKTKTITIQVADCSKGSGTFSVVNTNGTASNIIHDNTPYHNYGRIKNAKLSQEANGIYQRVEYINTKVIVEQYDSSFKLKSKREIKKELPIYGGYYSGAQYNYMVFGAENEKEDDKTEVLRVVKYDKAWKRVGACSIKGANTYYPFEAGSLDMTETGGYLYVHTCHEMYKSEDGYNHQANCTFKILEKDMTVADSFYGVMNISWGYVSHSFDQRIKTDGKLIYRVDLGDAYPRGITITMTDVESKITSPRGYGKVMDIPGEIGNNWTGFCLGDFGVTKDYVLVSGSGITEANRERSNIWLSSVDQETGEISPKWITKYSKGSDPEISVPKLVQINANQYLIMWEEHAVNKDKYHTKIALVTPNGELASDIYDMPFALSSCDPIVGSNGNVTWYITSEGSPTFISINPYKLSQTGIEIKNPNNKDAVNSAQNAGGKVVSTGKLNYRVYADKTAEYTGSTNKKATSVTIPATIKIDGVSYKVTSVSDNAFKGNKYIKKVVIGSNVRRIGKNAFSGCKKFKTVTFAKKSACTIIDEKAFYKCVSLTKFTIPSKVTTIGKQAFYGCKKLKNITIKTKKLKDKNVGSKAFGKINSKAKVKVPSKYVKKYDKMLKKKGLPKKAKVKK